MRALPSPACLQFYGQSRSNAWTHHERPYGLRCGTLDLVRCVRGHRDDGDPTVGYWGDLHTYTTGVISVTQPVPGLTRADWLGVAYYGATAVVNTFGVQLDALTNTVTIDGLNTIVPYTSNMWLGVSAGGTGSSDSARSPSRRAASARRG
jgi:hypothetical protein